MTEEEMTKALLAEREEYLADLWGMIPEDIKNRLPKEKQVPQALHLALEIINDDLQVARHMLATKVVSDNNIGSNYA